MTAFRRTTADVLGIVLASTCTKTEEQIMSAQLACDKVGARAQ
jgi:hypothetical protein